MLNGNGNECMAVHGDPAVLRRDGVPVAGVSDDFRGIPGRVVQIDPIKPRLKAPGAKRLQL
jgi:hypothetical protein